ncbi:MAG: metallophosphoesterase [Gemmatimonadales bacterium]|nr:metallophosphoesterase [Gemmatimonadales bacterium]
MKLAHLADPHLGIRQYHRLTPAGINQREADVANAFRAAIDDVIAVRPDAVVVAGDLFHAVRPSNAAIVFAFRQFQRLREALPAAPVVLIAGNHDTPRRSTSRCSRCRTRPWWPPSARCSRPRARIGTACWCCTARRRA